LIIFFVQSEIIGTPVNATEMLEKIRQLENQNQKQNEIFKNQVRVLLDENENFRRQIDGLIVAKVELFASLEDKIAQIEQQVRAFSDENENLKGEIDQQISQLDEKFNRFHNIQSSMQSDIAIIKNRQKPVIAFRATCAKHFSDGRGYNHEYPVIWKNTEYNIGNAFNPSTGTFTCPNDGIYSFYATSPVEQYSGRISMYINGSEEVRHYLQNNADEYKHTSPHAVFKLKRGDTVQISMTGHFTNPNTWCWRTYIQGHLIDLV